MMSTVLAWERASSCVMSLFALGYMNEIQHWVCAMLMSPMPSVLKECHTNRWITGHRAHSIQIQIDKSETRSSSHSSLNIAQSSHMFSRYMMLIKWWCGNHEHPDLLWSISFDVLQAHIKGSPAFAACQRLSRECVFNIFYTLAITLN